MCSENYICTLFESKAGSNLKEIFSVRGKKAYIVGWGGGRPLPISHPLGAFGASTLAPLALDLCAVKKISLF